MKTITYNVTGIVNGDSSTDAMSKEEVIATLEELLGQMKSPDADEAIAERGEHLLIIHTQVR